MNEMPETLLAPGDPPPYTVGNENGASPFLIVVDHAGRQIPRRLGDLGLARTDRDRHIAWDIGAGKMRVANSGDGMAGSATNSTPITSGAMWAVREPSDS